MAAKLGALGRAQASKTVAAKRSAPKTSETPKAKRTPSKALKTPTSAKSSGAVVSHEALSPEKGPPPGSLPVVPAALEGEALLAAPAAVMKVHERLASRGLHLVLLERPSCSQPDAPPTTEDKAREAMLSAEHLLLPRDVGAIASTLAYEMVMELASCPGGGVSLANVLWEDYFLPKAKTAVASIDAGASGAAGRAKAFGNLLGLLLFASKTDCWLREQEFHRSDHSTFRRLFGDLSLAWKLLLAQSDAELGLQPKEGVAGGYRPALLKLLRAWAESTRLLLEGLGHHCKDVTVMNWICESPSSSSSSAGK